MTSHSSTCSPKSLANDLETWPKITGLAALSDDHFNGKNTQTLDASTTHAVFVIRLKGPRHSFQPLSTAVSIQMNYMHNWTSPTTIKRKKHHTCRNVLKPSHGHKSCSKISSSVLSWAKLKKEMLTWLPAMQNSNWKRMIPGSAGSSSTHRHRPVRPEKRLAVHFT